MRALQTSEVSIVAGGKLTSLDISQFIAYRPNETTTPVQYLRLARSIALKSSSNQTELEQDMCYLFLYGATIFKHMLGAPFQNPETVSRGVVMWMIRRLNSGGYGPV